MADQEKKKSRTTTIVVIVLAAVILGAIAYSQGLFGSNTGDYAQFAQCLSASGAKMYGAYWCPHCQNQKKLFGSAANQMPYVECSNQDGTQKPECLVANIQGYPTWVFADGMRLEGQQSLKTLSEKTSCPLP